MNTPTTALPPLPSGLPFAHTQARILVVDDNPVNVALLESILEEEGFTNVTGLTDPRQVVASYLEHRYDLILLDIRMPYMDGHEVMRQLAQVREADDYLPVLVLTAQTDPETRLEALRNGAKDFITKPFDRGEVMQRIRNMLEVRALYNMRRQQATVLDMLVRERTRDLRDRERRLQTIMDHAPDAIIATDSSGRVTSLNRAARRMFAVSEITSGVAGTDIGDRSKGDRSREEEGRGEEGQKTVADRGASGGIGLSLTDLLVDAECHLEAGSGEVLARRGDGSVFPFEYAVGMLDTGSGDDVGCAGAIVVGRDATERKRAEQEMTYLANHDTITGLPNRTATKRHLAGLLFQPGARGTVVYLSVHGHQRLNDILGHALGEKLLSSAGQRLQEEIGTLGVVGSWGGAEFVAVLPAFAPAGVVQAKVQRLIEQVSRPHAVDGHEVLLQCRAGMARFPEDGENAADLIRRASMAMFATTGEECCGLFSQVMEDEANQWSTLEAALRYALERDQIDLHYQPKISLVDGRVMGMEALMRWHHPQLGMVPPVRFIPVAEETGLISSLGAWAIRRAIRDTQSWHAAGFTDLVVAVNLSARQLRNATLPAMLERQLRETNWDPAFLELEITESTAMENVNEAVVALEKLRQLGVGLAIDDFGTGYSSLAYLKRLPITTLKVDRSFVMDICDNPDDAAIAATIVAMSRTLGMKTVAEGVERLEHETFLRSVGCDYGQGYLYSRPLPAGDFTRYLEEHRR